MDVRDQSGAWYRQSWRHKETVDISCTALFVTHHEIWPNNGSYTITQVVTSTSSVIAMPRSISRISTIWHFYLVFEPHVHTTNGKPASLFCFSYKLWLKWYCFGWLYRSYLSDKKKSQKGRLFPFACWCMINTVSHNQVLKRTIEQNTANQPVWQQFGCPSS